MGYVGKIKDSSGTIHLVASTLFGTCSTAIGTAEKVVTCSNFSQLENGVTIHVYFVNGNTAASPTLNVNSTGAIAIKRYSTTAPQCSTQNWAAGQIVSFTYYEVSSTDKRWVMNDIDQRFDLLTGTGETAQDKGEGVSPRYFPAKWKFDLNKQPQDGDIITIRIPCAGHSYGVYISLDNGTNYKPVSVNNTTRLTTHYANGKTITLVYESAGSTATIYPVNGGDATQTVDGGCWTVLNYYDANNIVTQTNTTGNAYYRVLFSNTADNTTRTEAARKSTKLQFNPSTCTLQLYNESTTATNAPATILFSMKDTTTGKTYSGGYIKVYQDHGATPNGDNMVINSGGGMFLGSGESPSSHYSAKGSTYTGEDCFITADGNMHLQANGNTIANRKGLQITNGFALVPEQADVATDNVGSIGTSSYKWANGYFTQINGVTVGDTPVFTDTWRNIEVNGTEQLGSGTGTGALNFINGTNTTVTYDSGIQINATDTKVTQGDTTASGVRPLIMEYNSYVISSSGKNIETDYISEDTIGKVYRTNNIYASPASGRLYLSSTATPQMYLKYRTLDYTLADNGMSSEQWVGYRIVDKNNKVVALFHLDVFPDGKIGAFVRAGNYDSTTSSTVSGYMGVFAHKDGSVSYSISHKDEFREAIEVYSKLETETSIRSYLTSTVGHACKNWLDLSKYTYSSGISNVVIDETTGSLSFTGNDTNRAVNFIAADLGVEMYGKTYTVSCVNNRASTTTGRLAIRRLITNDIVNTVSFSTTGEKSITFTPNEEAFPNGWYISVLATGSTSTTGNIDISNFMLREASITDDTFEPYVTPTDEAKMDKPVELVSTATDRFTYPSVSELKSKYSMLAITTGGSYFASVTVPTSIIYNVSESDSELIFPLYYDTEFVVPLHLITKTTGIVEIHREGLSIVSIIAFPK